MKEKIKGYGVTSGGLLMYFFFAYRKDAIEWCKYQVSNRPGYDWHKSYKIVKTTLSEV